MRRIAMLCALMLAGPAVAEPPETEPPETDPGVAEPAATEPIKAEPDNPPPADGLPSLDELLGLESDSGNNTDAAEQRKLDDELAGVSPGEQFAQAVRLMDDAAGSLRGSPGLPTQRLQEDVLRKLDAVISAAQKQQKKSSSSSSSSSAQNQPQSSPQQSSQQGNRPSQSPASGDTPGTPPTLDGESPRSDLLPDASAWGALPERVRDTLRQGLNEQFSTLYQRLTERYYQRLAEEGEQP